MRSGDDGIATGRVRRAAPLAGMAARATGDAVIAALRRDREPGSHSTTNFAKRADRYVETLGASKGAIMKVGQLLSFIPMGAAVPAEYQKIFQAAMSRLQSDAPPMAPDLAARVVREELGEPPDAAFAHFEPMPFAAASIGQVHRARTRDGRDVAVKVQYPGVAEAIKADLENAELLSVLIGLMRSLFPRVTGIDPKVVAKEVSARVSEELDYRLEARNQQAFADAYRGHPFIRIPEVVSELSAAKVLTQDLAHGRTLYEAMDADQGLRDQWGEAIFRFAFGSLRRLGIFNADPHPGNYLFGEDGSVTFLDFGCVKHFDAHQILLIQDVVRAVVIGDGELLRRTFIASGLFEPDTAPSAQDCLDWYRVPLRLLTEGEPIRITPEHVARVIETEFSPVGPAREIVSKMHAASDFIFLMRVDVGLMSVLGALEPIGPWGGIQGELDFLDPPCSALGEQEADFWGDRYPLPTPPAYAARR
ncbi:MAG TPA: AarF/ABC1/UbiB kinase family protein [Mycobacteriales bacterium]|nr:AarF/ABC1/UbiB kinase family protein [Mycobacteriales bacterium]